MVRALTHANPPTLIVTAAATALSGQDLLQVWKMTINVLHQYADKTELSKITADCFFTCPEKVNSPRTVVSSPRKHPHSPKVVKKGDLAPTSLANFFKMGRPPNRETPNTKNNEKTCK